MFVRPTAPRSIGGVLDDAIRLYRASLSRCWVLVLIGGLLSAVVGVYVSLQFGALTRQTATIAGAAALLPRLQAVGRSPGLMALDVLASLFWLLFHAAVIRSQDTVANGAPESLGASLRFALTRLPAMVVGAIVFAMALTVGLVLLIIPGLWLWGQLQLWLVALCAEDLGPFGALGRSWRLIEHHWWRATTTVGVILMVILVLSMGGGLVIGVAALATRGDLVRVLLANQLVTLLINVFTTPLGTATMIAMYYDLKLRREGGDLAARVSSLQPV